LPYERGVFGGQGQHVVIIQDDELKIIPKLLVRTSLFRFNNTYQSSLLHTSRFLKFLKNCFRCVQMNEFIKRSHS